MVKKNLIYFLIPALLVLGFLAGVFLPVKIFQKAAENDLLADSAQKENLNDGLSFINKTVTAGIGKHFIINFQPLRQQFLEIQKNIRLKPMLISFI
jgi:hypothetical protein